MSEIKDFVICVIFEHNFDEDKAKSRRNAVAFQVILTQSSAKFVEKACNESYENKVLIYLKFQKHLMQP